MADTNKLGKRVKKYREGLGLTQEQLATNSGLEAEYIADVEEGRVYPPVGSIIKLSRALGQRVGTFMDDQFQPDPIIVRKDERVEETSNKAADGQYHYFPLGRGKTDRHMEPMFIRIMPDVAHTTSSHEGEEFIIVVSGKILVKYGKEETIIEEGDSAYFNAVVPHYIGAVDGPAEIYAVLYTPF
ncbi:MAG: cupin domain-containing protein [Candidatus Methanomethylophilaceae archaeon]|nr:cupin domain-containing protein [Candidatus Methanomethylophilaceae archaeon]MBR2348833.1 cupin domain-containing protein [Candidatus Methanomethylophilaceae archaeon]